MSDDCACLYAEDDGEPFTLFSERVLTVRASHRCEECRVTLPPGTQAERMVAKWEGQVSSTYTCLPCAEIRRALYCGGRMFGVLWEDVEHQIFMEAGLTVACVDKLSTPEAKTKLQQAWMTYLNTWDSKGDRNADQ